MIPAVVTALRNPFVTAISLVSLPAGAALAWGASPAAASSAEAAMADPADTMRVRECMLHLPLSDLQGMTPAVLCELLQAMGGTDVPPSVVRLSEAKRERLMARGEVRTRRNAPDRSRGRHLSRLSESNR